MIQVIDKSNSCQYEDILQSFSELRHHIFIEKLRWPLQCDVKGLETDQFDDENAIYLIVSNRFGQVVGGARLLHTSRKCLLNDVFADMVDGDLPIGPRIVEVTRFTVEDRKERLEGCGNVSAELLWGIQQYSAWAGIEKLVSVSYLTLEPILRRAGYQFKRLGGIKPMDGSDIVALAFEVSAMTREAAGLRMTTNKVMMRSSRPIVAPIN